MASDGMGKTRLSLFYLTGYLLLGGLGFLLVPQTTLRLLLSSGEYSDLMVRFVGLLLLALGILVVQIIRLRVASIYSTTLLVRAAILLGLLFFYVLYQDPLMLVLFGIVGIGFAFTMTCYVLDRSSDDLVV